MSVTERSRQTRVLLACVAAGGVIAAGCGASKPAYCTARSNLQSSVKGLTELSTSSGISGLKSQVQKVASDAKTVVNQAKSDFPNETSAIQSSVNTLQSSVQTLSSGPSASQVAKVTSDASALVTSTQNFYNASKSKCS